MKIAISSTGKDIESSIDPHFGRCPYFVIVEIKSNSIQSVKSIKNFAANHQGGAGITAAEIIANEKVNTILVGNMGPKAFNVFNQLGIDIYLSSGKIKAAIEEFLAGKLKKISSATGPGHSGSGAGLCSQSKS